MADRMGEERSSMGMFVEEGKERERNEGNEREIILLGEAHTTYASPIQAQPRS
jgi:hypothetical protein